MDNLNLRQRIRRWLGDKLAMLGIRIIGFKTRSEFVDKVVEANTSGGEGMLAFQPDGELQWNMLELESAADGRFVTHVVPYEQFVHTVDSYGRCLCGPQVNTWTCEEGHPHIDITHQPLDARFYENQPADM